MYSSQYDNLRKESYDFSFRYAMCSDIEYRKNISKEGLIAIDILEDVNKKVKLKVRGKKFKFVRRKVYDESARIRTI